MRKFNLLAAVAVTLMIGGAAFAQEKAERAPKEKKICKVDKSTKSRIPKRTCLTQAEWDSRTSQGALDAAEAKLRGIGT
jgi:hypothetical protein